MRSCRTVSRNYKILLVCGLYYPVIGGAERECQKHAEALVKKGHQVIVLTQRLRGLKSYEIINGVKVYRAIRGWRPWAIGYLVSTFIFMVRFRRRYDLIQCYGIFYHTTAAVWMKRLFGKKVASRLECAGENGDIGGIKRLKYGFIVKRFWTGVDRVIAISREICGELKENGVHEGRIEYIPNCVDTTIFKPKSRKDWGGCQRRLLFVGRLAEQKGVRFLIRSLKRIHERGYRDVSLTIVGGGPLREALEGLANECGVSGQVNFVGEKKDVVEYYQNCDILVLPSLWEGLPLTMLEGMACGLPIVASDLGGHRDAIIDGINGFLFPPGNEGELASKIISLLENEGEARRMGLMNRQEAVIKFSLEHIIRRYEEVYSSMLCED